MNALRLPQIKVLLGLILFVLPACTAAPTPTEAPVVETPTTPPIPLSRQVSLTAISFREEGRSPAYVIYAETPMLIGSDHPHVRAFNEEARQLIEDQINHFRENILEQAYAHPGSPSSSFNAQYTLFQHEQIWSFKFDFSVYANPAYPNHYTRTLTYDLEQGHALALGDLFPPDSDYLQVISSHCVVKLSNSNIGFYGGFQQGAEPTVENYRTWYLTPQGLTITFGEAQVAPYAMGQQTVIVPYTEIKSLINPKSPLAMFQP